MKPSLKTLAFFLLLQGCGSSTSNQSNRNESSSDIPTRKSESYFQPYINKLETILSKAIGDTYKITTPIVFNNELAGTEVLGKCWRYGDYKHRDNYIEISSDLQKVVSGFEDYQEQLLLIVILHELGHCEFFRDHDNKGITRTSNRIKVVSNQVEQAGRTIDNRWGYEWQILEKSIMWPYIGNPSKVYLNIEEYAKELGNENYYPSDTSTVFDLDPKKLGSLADDKHYEVYDKNNNKILSTMFLIEFYEMLYGSFLLVNRDVVEGELKPFCDGSHD